jgi:rhodanese-related sulfurtransferase/glyoxylase-like metal-dependent hydrolase (beta-lactamase superfamily II)
MSARTIVRPVALSLALLLAARGVAPAQDAERATHGDEAATPQVSYERTVGAVTLRQYQLGCLSQLTYLIVSGAEAVVVDPQRDVEHYVRDAKELGARILYVALTHTNADFVAGHTELAARQGAEILISADSGSRFPHRGLRDGDRVPLGAATIEFWATPGHTLDSMSLLVRVPGGEADPLWLLTGDALFIGSIGRPDLAQGTVSPTALASRGFDTIQRLRSLPDATILLPGHGAGSLCGAHLSPDTTSTIGREKATNPYFAIASRTAFIARDISGLPPAPAYFAHNVAMNRAGPPVIDWSEEMPAALSPAEVASAIEGGAWVVDLRDAREYARLHVEGSVNVAVRGRLDTWTGVVIPFEAPLVLVGSADEVREAAFRFKRIGLDRVLGHLAVELAADLEAARAAGLATRSAELVPPTELAARIAEGMEPMIVDVRTADENAELSIGHYVQVDLSDWLRFDDVLDREQPVLFVCNSAYRSSMAVGLAERLGFREIASLDGGLDAWLDAGLPVIGSAPICAAPVGTAAPVAAVTAGALAIPEPVEPEQLASLLLDQAGSYALLDVRPAWQFREYHVPGAANVEPAALLAHVKSLPRSARIVLVDRDGTAAWALAGGLAAALGDDARVLRVLAGGTARFWREVEIGGGAPLEVPGVQPVPATAPGGEPAPARAKKRGAGC